MCGTVELKTAYHWNCEECGADNFTLPQKAEFADDDEREECYRHFNEIDSFGSLPDDWRDFEMVHIPSQVTCKECGAVFTTIDEREANP